MDTVDLNTCWKLVLRPEDTAKLPFSPTNKVDPGSDEGVSLSSPAGYGMLSSDVLSPLSSPTTCDSLPPVPLTHHQTHSHGQCPIDCTLYPVPFSPHLVCPLEASQLLTPYPNLFLALPSWS
jgi:hypothetical protein